MTLKFFDQSLLGQQDGDCMYVDTSSDKVMFETRDGKGVDVGTHVYLVPEQVRKLYNALGAWLDEQRVPKTSPKLWEEM